MNNIRRVIRRNKKCIAKVACYGAATLGALAVEIAGSIEVMNKIVDGCDENNPANFGQTLGVIATSLAAGVVETATAMGGMLVIENEIEENWE